jgi:carbon storage regulator CsrA
MLVLSRRLHEKILFPGLNITVQVVAIKPGVIRIGIEAPPDVRIVREEILGQPSTPPATGTML